ncbi:tetratricopeptide repeat protein [Reticulibacter mediterranei]|uniref:Tetratricopeptide repeat protein n=1 Tax=Reticulibacter mediterranei TaxID=2778369 RepID=A0A8J3IN83_9CHLR|nr:tetratricopeptide repeat protein [Reticulibacter mediterranei]
MTIVVVLVSYWLWQLWGLSLLSTAVGTIGALIAIIAPLYGFLLRWHKDFSEEKHSSSPPQTETPPMASSLREIDKQKKHSPEVWNVPYHQSPFFTGRESLLKQIYDNLTSGKTTALAQPQTINGLGGVGKTQCAVEYAYRHRQEYRYVFWVNAASRETFIADYVTIAALLKLPESGEPEQARVIERVKGWLAEHDLWLLILDNADDLNMAYTFLPTTGTGHILLTTREQAAGPLARSIEVKEMDIEEGAVMLLRRTKLLARDASLDQANQQEREQARNIVLMMGGLPLALDQAGAYIEENACTLAEYLEAFEHRQADLLRRRGRYGSDHPDPVATSWSLSFEKVEQNNALASSLLRFCAFLAPDDIPEDMIVKGAIKLGPALQPLAHDPTLLREVVGELSRFSLIRRSPDHHTLSMHRLVQAVLKSTMSQDEQRHWAEWAIQTVSYVFPVVEPTTWPQCQRYLPHALVCAELIKQWQIESIEGAWLLHTTGRYLNDRAQYAEAESLLQRALYTYEHLLILDHLDPTTSTKNLAGPYYARGRYEQADLLYQRAIHIKEHALAPDHPNTASGLNNLALLYQDQGKYEQAESLFQRALLIYEHTFGLDHLDTATILNNLALLYQDQSKYEQARSLLQRALHLYEQTLGPDHPNTAMGLNNLALLYQDQGKYEQAEPLFRLALHIYEQALGPTHLNTAMSLNNLARLYQDQGKYEQAESLFQRALRIYEQAEILYGEHTLGPDHPNTTMSLNNLALLYQDQGKYEQAETLYKQVLAHREKLFGPDHPTTLSTLKHLDELQQALKQREAGKNP